MIGLFACVRFHSAFYLQLFLCLANILITQQCEDGWAAYDGHCYYINNEAMPWHSAKGWCMERGGDLASILSKDEQNFTNNFMKQSQINENVWIGLNQLSDRITLTWSDGSVVEYTNWVSGYPSNDELNLCTYLLSTGEDVLFTRYANDNKMKGVLSCPTCTDGVDTFYFGYIYSTEPDECEARCLANARCYLYTFYSSLYSGYVWAGECVGAANETGVLESENYVFSGVRNKIPVLDIEPTWQTTNCGVTKRFMCERPEQSTSPITTVPPPTAGGYCPSEYYGIGNKCFKLFRGFDGQTVNWTQALAICRTQPGFLADLASISNQDEQDLIIAQLRDFEVGAWIGLNYVVSEGSWLWTDNTHVGYVNWKPNEPNQANERCVEMATWVESWEEGIWNNVDCTWQRGYVCQTYKDASAPITTPPPTPFNCPSNYVAYWYACYRFVSAQVTWAEADQSCRNDGAYLSSIHSEPENTAIRLYAANKAQLPLWIGMKKNPDNEFVWTDNWSVRYTNWMLREPSNDECVIMTSSGEWDAVPCTNTSGYVCKFTEESVLTTPPNIGGTCPPNWVSWGSDCYTFSSSYSDTVSYWSNGMTKCQQLAGDGYSATLASIHSAAENMFIYDTFVERGLITDYTNAVYIGFTQNTANGPFYWADGSAFQYTLWAPEEPNYSPTGTTQCGDMLLKSWPGHWNDHPCNTYSNKFYVCKTPQVPPTTAPILPTVGSGSCPSSEWYRYSEWCFLFRPDKRVDWDVAWLTCEQEGGAGSTLASIHDFSENYFIWKTMLNVTQYPTSYNCYIGLYKTGSGYPHRWLDGSQVDYSYWANGQPDDSGGVEHCVVMLHSNGQWADVPCTDLEGYVCKIRQAAGATTTNYK